MTGMLDEREVRSLLERATADVVEARAPLAAVLEGGRRRRRAARLQASAVLTTAAATVLAVAVGVAQLQPTEHSGGPASAPAVIDPAAGTVQLGGVTVKVPDGWSVDEDGRCGTPRMVVVLNGVGMSGCGDGPSIVLSHKVSQDWAPGSNDPELGLTTIDSAPVWVQEGGSKREFLSIPYAGVFVELDGTAAQRADLRERLTIAVPAAPALRKAPIVEADLHQPSGYTARLVAEPDRLAAVTAALEAARVVPVEARCVPAPARQVEVSLQTSPDSDPENGPVGDFTSLITAFTGTCRLAYSSTGAVVKPGPEFFEALGGPLTAKDK